MQLAPAIEDPGHAGQLAGRILGEARPDVAHPAIVVRQGQGGDARAAIERRHRDQLGPRDHCHRLETGDGLRHLGIGAARLVQAAAPWRLAAWPSHPATGVRPPSPAPLRTRPRGACSSLLVLHPWPPGDRPSLCYASVLERSGRGNCGERMAQPTAMRLALDEASRRRDAGHAFGTCRSRTAISAPAMIRAAPAKVASEGTSPKKTRPSPTAQRKAVYSIAPSRLASAWR